MVGKVADNISIPNLNLHIDWMAMARRENMAGEKLIDLDRQPQESVTPFTLKVVSKLFFTRHYSGLS